MFTYLEQLLLAYAHTLSLPVFVCIASFVEEVVAPIPSPTIMMLTGSLAKVQEYSLLGLIPLILLGTLGKTLGAFLVYMISDKAENLVMHSWGAFFGVSRTQVEDLGKKLGNGYRDYILLTILRALPFIPSVVISVGSGLLKIPLRLFIVTTVLGTIIRDGIYLYVGYQGTEFLVGMLRKADGIESYVEILVLTLVCALIGWLLYSKFRNGNLET